jgi:DNA-binding FadR family transcriptional regulator
MRLHPAMTRGERKVIPFRTATMSTQLVAQVRDALFAKELRPGDFLGTEKHLAERFGVSRIVARDALRTLEAQGVVEIKVGAGGGARIAQGKLDDVGAYTRAGREFHLAVAEASHNRVLVVQLVSLQHVSWPARNPTLTPKVARRILAAHKELTALIEMRDAAGARKLMDEHVRMIGARRIAEHRMRGDGDRDCC